MDNSDNGVKSVLEMIEDNKISPEEGYLLIQEIRRNNCESPARQEVRNFCQTPGEKLPFPAVVLSKPGYIDDIEIKNVCPGDPGPGEVQILVKAFSLNFGDLLCVQGFYPTMPDYPFTPGLEVSGEVIKTGAGVSRVHIGDEVIAIMGPGMGGHSIIAVTNEKLVVKKPKNVSHEEACSFPIVFLTVDHIFKKAGLQRGEKVLIQTAAGGIGLTAVQHALLKDAEIYATAGSETKLEYLKNMGVHHAINYLEDDFASKIMDLTNGYGVDIIINTLSGDAIQKGINILAPGGRYFEIAQTGLKTSGGLDLSKMVANQTFYSMDLRKMMLSNPGVMSEHIDEMARVLEEANISPTVGRVFPFGEIKEAYRYMENRENIGKIVVTVAKDFTECVSANTGSPLPVTREHTAMDVAIIGMSGRFSGARNVEEYWQNISLGKSSVTEVPADRWDIGKYYDPDPKKLDKTYCKWGGFLDDIYQFDPLFFNMTTREAVLTDPQQRLFLEECWNALEDAGYANEAISGKKCGVFAGAFDGDYDHVMRREGVQREAQSFWGNSGSVLAARISYFLNLKGPSLAVDTACSSSLVALHLGCRSILSGECEMAIAGGVYISLTPDFHIVSSNAGMLSPEGKCKTFDNDADGFVPGEGVGAVVLKPLALALRDRDHIYGVIKGSAINQDGRTNGITAPSSLSQTDLELSVYKKFSINPQTISYVETHGTGTKLGDPIEMEALTDAFNKYTGKNSFCAVGSVKTNIGHCVTAAGVASVIKVLLALKHKQIPPSINFSHANEHINFENSPFYVSTRLLKWKTGGNTPRRAAISSFGFSGTNAHMVIEEAPEFKKAPLTAGRSYYLIPFSARSSDQLKQKMEDMAAWVERGGRDNRLEDIAFTLLAGRKHFPVRSSLVVRDVRDLLQSINRFLHNKQAEGYTVNTPEETALQPNSPVERTAEQLLEELQSNSITEEEYRDKLMVLADLYVKGSDLQAENLYRNQEYSRISLPAYPFDRQSCGIPVKPKGEQRENRSTHPLIDGVNYGLSLKYNGIVLEKTFKSSDLIVKDHRVQGMTMLPGAGHMEMAHAASRMIQDKAFVSLSGVVWKSPLVVQEGEKKVHLVIKEEGECLRYKIQDSGKERIIVYSEGYISFEDAYGQNEILSIDEIKARCQIDVDKQDIYSLLKESGLLYGPYFQSLEHIWHNGEEALGLLVLPPGINEEISNYTMHPSLADGALQTIACFMAAGVKNGKVLLFGVDEVNVIQPIKSRSYAYVRKAGVNRCHLTVMDEYGQVCLKFKGVSVRKQKEPLRDFFYMPGWRQALLPDVKNELAVKPKTVLIIYTSRSLGIENALARYHREDEVVLIKLGKETRREESGWEVDTGDPLALNTCLDEVKDINTIYFWGGVENNESILNNLEAFEQVQTRGVITLFRLLKSIVNYGFSQKSLQIKTITNGVHRVLPRDKTNPFSAGLIGLAKSINMEFPGIEACAIDISLDRSASKEEVEALAGHIACEPGHSRAEEIAIREGIRYVRTVERALLPPAATLPFKQDGVYMILGGAGGIGMELSRYLAETVQARLVLVGRSDLNSEKTALISEIESKGGEVLYIKADAADFESMKKALENAKQRFGKIDGVVHSALAMSDNTLERISEEDFVLGLAPKTKGSLVVYQVTKDEPLDFLVFFSSVAAFLPNVGASYYSAGLAFEDAFAYYLNELCPFPVKTINWGYWGHVGAGAKQGLDRLFSARGIEAHSVDEGMEAICRILDSPSVQIISIKANERFLKSIGADLNSQVELYPGYVPSVMKAVVEGFNPPQPEESLIRYDLAAGKLEEFTLYLLLDSFQRMGVFRSGSERCDSEELEDKLNIRPGYRRLYKEMLRILAGAGLIETRDDYICTTGKLEETGLKEILAGLKKKRNQLNSDYPGMKNHLKLLWTSYCRLPGILRGEIPATEVIFPNSSLELVEGIYRGNAAANYFNSLATGILRRYMVLRLPLLEENEKINILEVGAGTGGTSSEVFSEIRGYGEKLAYYYTDISAAFTKYGREMYAPGNPFVEFEVLNIEKDIVEQGFNPGGMDMVIATNVLHATRDIRNTLKNIKKLLKRNGWLIINELTGARSFFSLTFGLLDGWWLYEDQDNRIDGSPLLSRDTWVKILKEEGFKTVTALGPEEILLKEHSQHVIISESDGFVKYSAPVHKPAPAECGPQNGEKENAQQGMETYKRSIENKIAEIIAGVTQIDSDQVDPDIPFNDLGVDSIFATEIVNQVNDEFSLKLRANDLMSHSTIRSFAGFVVGTEKNYGSTGKRGIGSWGEPGAQTPVAPLLTVENTVKPQRLEGRLSGEAVAIIGVGGVMPRSDSLESFWASLINGKKLITEIPGDRWDWKVYYGDPAKETNKTGSKWGGFINGFDEFDAALFGISPREAKYMDPQQRIFLQVVWSAIEDAGYKYTDWAGSKTGVFVGTGTTEYAELISVSNIDIEPLVLTGTEPSLIANRVSHFFDLKGPSEVVDTTCSGSAVAVHRAVSAIRRGECGAAIAGGVNMILSPTGFIGLSKAGMLSHSGVVRPFDMEADGFVLGEGAGAVLLKPLSRAEEDNDHIYAVIRGSAVNHGGRRNSLVSPDTTAQSEVIVEALKNAGVYPETLTYIESHGTGAGPGDQAEINAYHEAFSKLNRLSGGGKNHSKYCGIGSVKPNIGHLESASGISALIKIIFALRDKMLPATLNFRQPCPEMCKENSPFYMVDMNQKWEPLQDEEGGIIPRRAGVHSFGFGGTNAHLIVEEYLPKVDVAAVSQERDEKFQEALVFSARTNEVLRTYLENMSNFFKQARGIRLQDVAYTLRVGREAMEERLAIVVNSMQEAVKTLDRVLNNKIPENAYKGSAKPKAGITQEALTENTVGDPAILAQRWVHGADVDWSSLGGNRICKRIPLPTYPFAGERYWFDQIRINGEHISQTSADHSGGPKAASGNSCHPEDQTQRQLKKMVSELLEVPDDEINVEENLKKYGFDSLMAMRLSNRISEIFGKTISLKNILMHLTVVDLSRLITLNSGASSGQESNPGVSVGVDGSGVTGGKILPGIKGAEEKLYEFIIDELIAGGITPGKAAEITGNLRKYG